MSLEGRYTKQPIVPEPPPKQYMGGSHEDGVVTLIGGKKGALQVWHVGKDGKLAAGRRVDGHKEMITSIAVLSSGHVVTGTWDSMLGLWSAELDFLWEVKASKNEICCIVELPDGHIATSGIDDDVDIWWLHQDTLQRVRTLEGHSGQVSGMVLLPDGTLACLSNGSLRLFSTDTMAQKRCIEMPQGYPMSLVAHPLGLLAQYGLQSTAILPLAPTAPGIILPRLLTCPQAHGVLPSGLVSLTARGREVRVLSEGDLLRLKTGGALPPLVLPAADREVRCLLALRCGWVVGADIQGGMTVWDADAGSVLDQFSRLQPSAEDARALAVLHPPALPWALTRCRSQRMRAGLVLHRHRAKNGVWEATEASG